MFHFYVAHNFGSTVIMSIYRFFQTHVSSIIRLDYVIVNLISHKFKQSISIVLFYYQNKQSPNVFPHQAKNQLYSVNDRLVIILSMYMSYFAVKGPEYSVLMIIQTMSERC